MKKSFKTDSDIANSKFKERELEKWVPESTTNDVHLSLDDDHGNWDQFQVNKDKFGIDSTYDEHLYTTRINKDAKDYHVKLKQAEKLANEIENTISSDPHIMEERGKIDDSGIDEEDKYSGVQRDTIKDTRGDELMAALKSVNLDTTNKKYVPPKSSMDHHDPAIVSTGNAKKPESFRLNAQSEINSLKQFSATFKVPHKLPNDLLPILSKDKLKQDEILKRTEKDKGADKEKSQENGKEKKKMDPTKPAFNPNAASFTPNANSFTAKNFTPKPKSFSQQGNNPNNNTNNNNPNNNNHNNHPHQHSNHRDYKDYKNPSPRTSQTRPYSSKRHYQISPQDFFGSSSRIPTKASQLTKIENFKKSFNMFAGRDTVEKAFITPPTWDLTVDKSYSQLFEIPPPSPMGVNPGMQGMSPMMMNNGMNMGLNPMMMNMANMQMGQMGMNPMMMNMPMQMGQVPNMGQLPNVNGMNQMSPMQMQMPMQFMPMFPQSPLKYSPNYSPYNSPQSPQVPMYHDENFEGQKHQGPGQPQGQNNSYRRYSKK